jgi:integrin-linked kinase-associated serine/threonine phosphatase 2C
MKIFVRPDKGTKKDDVEVDINIDALMETVRKKIQEKTGVDCSKLMFKGKNLDNEKTLRSYDVVDGSVIIVKDAYENQYLPLGITPQMEKRKADEIDADEVDAPDPEAKRRAIAASMEDIREADIPSIQASCAAYGEKGMRRQMEDEYVICTSLRGQCPDLPKDRDFAVVALFDGHGGKQVAGFIKTYLAMELGIAFAADEPKDGPLTDKRLKKATEAAFQRLDTRIATELPGCYDGSTACVVIANAETVICANLGDSMAYLSRTAPDGDIQAIPLQMRQHKCWMMKEKERILRFGGAVENGRINGVLEVSRAFGDITLKKFGVLCTPEYMKFKVDRAVDRFVILGCDGFWNAWTAPEALEFIGELIDAEDARAEREGEKVDLKGCCRDVVQHVLEEKKAQDNVSVVLLRFNGAT